MKKEVLDNFIKINDLYDFEVTENTDEICNLEFDKLKISILEKDGQYGILTQLAIGDVFLNAFYERIDIPIKDQDCARSTDPFYVLLNKKHINEDLAELLNIDMVRDFFKIDSFKLYLDSAKDGEYFLEIGKGLKFKIEDLGEIYNRFIDCLNELKELL